MADRRDDQCETCKYWDREGGLRIVGRGTKPCRRYAPIASTAKVVAQWPLTKPDDWCGEWKPR